MNVILLSGGSGTRLWPLSNEVRSKQFLKILKTEDGKHESMLQRVYRLIREVSPNSRIVIATSENQVASIKRQLGQNVEISIEPCRKDTFPAIALSVSFLHDVLHINSNEQVVVCPVDPLVGISYFETIKQMYEIAGRKNLTLMGIKPTYPSEKYGYILPNNGTITFLEKPDRFAAEKMISQGAFWNGGVFAFKISYILEKAKELCGFDTYQELLKNYHSLEKISFDYAVAENEKDIKMVEYHGEWKDLGTWNTFTEAMSDTIGGNATIGENCQNVHIVNELSIPVVALGLQNVVVAATPDGILVSDKNASAQLKKYVPMNRPMFEKRLWGEYKVLDFQTYSNGKKSLTRELSILPGKSISYQKHFLRDEIWVIVNGKGLMVLNGKKVDVYPGNCFYIKRNSLHSIKALEQLQLLEIQIGDDLLEEDIERYEFFWDE